jgi:hypothetical protein
MTSTRREAMFGIGPKNPKRVAERQLNQARLDLLEVCTSLESYESNKRTLTERIARLEAYLGTEAPKNEHAQDDRTPVQRVRDSVSPSSLAARVASEAY